MTFSPEYNLSDARNAFSIHHDGRIYLNHASISPLPLASAARMHEVITTIAERGSDVHARVLAPLVEESLVNISVLVHADVNEVTLVPNTCTGLNLVANSLPLSAGDNILLCDVEFPSNVYPWINLQHKGIETRLLKAEQGGLSLDALEQAKDSRSRVLAVSGVQFFTGRREDLAALGAWCHDNDILLVVDAIQSAGIVPIDIPMMGVDVLVTGAQKALMGPPGMGFMAVRSEVLETMRPAFLTPLGFENWEQWLVYDKRLAPGARKFDTSTVDVVALAGFNESVKFLLGLGIPAIDRWVTYLSDSLIESLSAMGLSVITPRSPVHHASIVTATWPGDALALVEKLEDEGIIISSRSDSRGVPHIRISTHCYNTEEEIIHVIDRLEGMR